MKDIEYMILPLPADIEREKNAGFFEEAGVLIERYLQDPSTPECMKKRLNIEKEVLKRIPGEFPYTEEEGLAIVRKEIPTFSEEDLYTWVRSGAILTQRIRGERHLHHLFFDSMKKVYPSIGEAAGVPHRPNVLLNEMMRRMKEQGSCRMSVRLRTEITVPEESVPQGKVLVHIPLPAEAVNCQNIRLLSAEPEPLRIGKETDLMRTAAFAADVSECRKFSVEYAYESYAEYTAPDQRETWVNSDHDLEEQYPQIVFTPYIKALCREITGNETDPLKKARKIYDFVTKQMTYAFVPEYLTLGQIQEFAASYRKGDCGVQALLFITLCRCAGIPAKWQSGKYVTPEHVGNHDWAMFEVMPYGWLFADCSFGGAAWRAGDGERHDFYFGNLDPYRLVTSNAFMQEFDPPKKQWRIDPYDNQSGEAETDERGLLRHEFESETVLVGMTEIK